jgi:hypothetical protein
MIENVQVPVQCENRDERSGARGWEARRELSYFPVQLLVLHLPLVREVHAYS